MVPDGNSAIEMKRSNSNNSIVDVETNDENENEDDYEYDAIETTGFLKEERNDDGSWHQLFGALWIVGITLVLLIVLVTGRYYARHDEGRLDATGTQQILPPHAGGESDNESGGAKGTVLVTGATGRLGALLYRELKSRGETVRAFVRDADKARTVLGCSTCDESEGIYIGDVTRPSDLHRAVADGTVSTLAVAVGASPNDDKAVQKAVEFDGVVESVRALGMSASPTARSNLAVVFCSSMGTETTPVPDWSGDILHWKLNAEAFLATSGIPVTIVKPCGLPADMPGKNATLVVGHHGTITENSDFHTISREDVASVMAEAVDLSRSCEFHRNNNLRFDLCSKPGPPTTDLKGLLESARWEWDLPGE